MIIPARNEEKNIGRLLSSLQLQDYPAALTDLIVVDDHSEDETVRIARGFPGVRVVSLAENPETGHKKKAIETGIEMSNNDWILTTDADCMASPDWIKTISEFASARNSVFIAAPVVIENSPGLAGWFQSMDFIMLQAITGATINSKTMSMCNGANLAYRKDAFKYVNGFEGINDIASGDDMLLMFKIQQAYPDQVHYLKSKLAIINTRPVFSWKEFFLQRIRWASKARKYQDKRILPVLLLVYAFNLSFLFLGMAALWYQELWIWLVGFLMGKTIVELPLFCAAATFFNRKQFIPVFLFFQPLHIIYTILSGTFSQFGKYEWKGRRVR